MSGKSFGQHGNCKFSVLMNSIVTEIGDCVSMCRGFTIALINLASLSHINSQDVCFDGNEIDLFN
jgi:hypothetical protein